MRDVVDQLNKMAAPASDKERLYDSNLNSAGIVDASKVVREALTTAASLALMLLTSDVLIAKSDGNHH